MAGRCTSTRRASTDVPVCGDLPARAHSLGLPRIAQAALATATSSAESAAAEKAPAPRVEACPICLEPMTSKSWRHCACGHGFHEACILRWVQHARHPRCPMCRCDLEASALSDFEAEFRAFRAELVALQGTQGNDLLAIRTHAEQCRRRLYDATLIRLLKLLQTSGAPSPEGGESISPLILELLTELQNLRDAIAPARSENVAAQAEDAKAAEFLGHVCDKLHEIQVLLRGLTGQEPAQHGGEERQTQGQGQSTRSDESQGPVQTLVQWFANIGGSEARQQQQPTEEQEERDVGTSLRDCLASLRGLREACAPPAPKGRDEEAMWC